MSPSIPLFSVKSRALRKRLEVREMVKVDINDEVWEVFKRSWALFGSAR